MRSLHTIIGTNCFEEGDAHVIVVHQTVEDDSTRKKKHKNPPPQKKKPLQWQQNFKQKSRKMICSWSFTCSGDTLPFRVVGCHVALRMHTALATITHVHETGFNKFMFNSQEWIVIGGCCSSSHLRICKYCANPFGKPLLNVASQQSEKFQTSNSLCLSYSRLDANYQCSFSQVVV